MFKQVLHCATPWGYSSHWSLCKWHPLDLLPDVTYVAASTFTPQSYVHAFKHLGQQKFIPSSSPASQGSRRSSGWGQVRIPVEYTAAPPRPTVRLLPPQVGRSTFVKPHRAPKGPLTYAHTPPPHTLLTHMCTMQAGCRAPDLQAPV